ncbi:putative ABC transporter permease [Dehalobacter sp. DCM]|nr:putative ABC transporter permease [Dehalobacter sp. DCM]
MGWSLEILWTGLNSLIHGDFRMMGFTNLWMFFIYGSAVFLEPLHDKISHWRWPLRGLIWLMVIWGIEYISGLILLKVLGVYPWEYTDSLAINGFITLGFAPVWFCGGLLFEKVHRKMDDFILLVNRLTEK